MILRIDEPLEHKVGMLYSFTVHASEEGQFGFRAWEGSKTW